MHMSLKCKNIQCFLGILAVTRVLKCMIKIGGVCMLYFQLLIIIMIKISFISCGQVCNKGDG